jgi:hypothetical protein
MGTEVKLEIEELFLFGGGGRKTALFSSGHGPQDLTEKICC